MNRKIMVWIVVSVILIKGFNAKNEQQIVSADVPSVAKPVLYKCLKQRIAWA